MDAPFNIEATSGEFDLSHGFLPATDPILQLPESLIEWEACAAELPKLLVNEKVIETVLSLPEFNVAELKAPEEYERAMMLLSYIAHAYVWGVEKKVPDHLPTQIAKPWYQVAEHIGRPPVLSYASYALYNWKRIDIDAPIALGNIELLQNFLAGIDEEWFILVHIEIEAHAISGIQAILPAFTAVEDDDVKQLMQSLNAVAQSLEKMCDTLDRMPEHCDPYMYYRRVRPYIHGWKDNPALPNGLVYEGVDAYEGKPQKFKGETGAQSSIIPAFDRLLGVAHADNPLKQHLLEMQQYMPPSHRRFLEYLEARPSVREFVKAHRGELRDIYNQCIKLIGRFRLTHLQYAAQYIQKQSQTSLANPTEVGTGGTPFMEYLRKHEQETEQYLL